MDQYRLWSSARRIGVWFGLVAVLCLLVLSACGGNETEETAPESQEHPEPVTQPDATPASGGLGLSREEWEAAHPDGDGPVALFTDDRAHHVEQNLGWGTSLDDARRVGQGLIPDDALLEETYTPADYPELTVELYSSHWLKRCFQSDVWTGGEPGQFIVVYPVYDGEVPRVVIDTGNNP